MKNINEIMNKVEGRHHFVGTIGINRYHLVYSELMQVSENCLVCVFKRDLVFNEYEVCNSYTTIVDTIVVKDGEFISKAVEAGKTTIGNYLDWLEKEWVNGDDDFS